MVVPIFSPKIIAAPTSKGIIPFRTKVSVRAIAALEDCTTTVTSVPNRTNAIRPKNGESLNCVKKCTIGESASKVGTASFKNPRPIKSIANPMMAFAQPFALFLERNISGAPKPINIRA